MDGPHFTGSHSVRVGDRTFTVERGAGTTEGQGDIPDKTGQDQFEQFKIVENNNGIVIAMSSSSADPGLRVSLPLLGSFKFVIRCNHQITLRFLLAA